MKKLIHIFIVLLSIYSIAQDIEHNPIRIDDSTGIALTNIDKTPSITSEKLFNAAIKKSNIPYKKLENLKGVKNGFYLIAGVYKNDNNLTKLIKKLKKKGLNAGFINNTTTNLKYVYAGYYTNWQKAIEAYESKFNTNYTEKVWLLNIENSEPINSIVKKDISSSKENAPSIKNSKLIEKADNYFNKMWYAEAAELYEEVLEKGENHTVSTLKKVGDAHYYNTNMEKAHYWYDILYNNYKNEMSSDNIFKYAHSLKGTGKYGRAKKLMRLYNKKGKGKQVVVSNDNLTTKEKALDRLLDVSQKYDIKNLAINTEYSEFSPIYYENEKVVFASAKDSSFFNTRRYKWNDQPYLDLYVAKVNKESQEFKKATKFSKKINTKYHEASVAFSPDNKTMYFTRNNYNKKNNGKKLRRDNKGINHLKIYTSTKIEGEWTTAVELPFNSDDYSTGHPAISPDGKQLYFVSDMPGSIGQTDIFVVDVLKNGAFSKPRNLGPQINTEKREMFPFINGKKLYFSSDGHTGIGGLDIFEAIYKENGFANALNLGKPINSKLDDFSYIVDKKNQNGYFASNRKGGKGDDDIYSFKRLIPEEDHKNAIAGIVTDIIDGNLMSKALVVLLDENNIKLKEYVTDNDGSFIFEDLEGDKKYTIKTTKESYFDNEKSTIAKTNDIVTIDVALKKLKDLIAVEEGIKKIKIENIYFDFDRFNIRAAAKKELDSIVAIMRKSPNMVIKIESHTDSRGKKAYNKYLSNKRAESSKNYLISKGIDPNRIQSAIGYGEERLLNGCDGSIHCTEKQHLENRRSEFIIVKM